MILQNEEDFNEINEIPMTNAYKLLCEDLYAQRDIKSSEKSVEIAKKIIKILNSAKLDVDFNFKECDYWTLSDIKYPLERCTDAIKSGISSVTNFKWDKPKKADIVYKICDEVRIFVEMPDELFGNRDFINLNYIAKRAHYGCAVIKILKALKHDEFKKFCFFVEDDDFLFPDVLIKTEFKPIRISFYNGSFAKGKRFIPSIGNLRPLSMFKKYEGKNEISTPYFNQRYVKTLEEVKVFTELEKKLKKSSDTLISYYLLMKLFEKYELERVSRTIIPARILRLFNNDLVSDKQEIVAFLRLVMKDLLTWKSKEVVYVGDENLDEVLLEEYKSNFDYLLINDNWNVSYNIDTNDINRVKSVLSECFPLVGDVYSFDTMFIEGQPFYLSFDYLTKIEISINDLSTMINKVRIEAADNNDLLCNFIRMFKKLILKTIGERLEYFDIKRLKMAKQEWSADEYCEDLKNTILAIGFRSNTNWVNPLTIGPVAVHPDAKEFRELWKGKSELRKFADTRICECVVWSDKSSTAIPRKILEYVLIKVLSMENVKIAWTPFNHDGALSKINVQEEMSNAYAELAGCLRSLKGLPLSITNVYGISPYIRGTEPAMPSIYAVRALKSTRRMVLPEEWNNIIPPFSPAVTVHIKLEYSGKWGTDVEAIRRLTSSFYVKMAEKLRERKLAAVATVDQIFMILKGIVFKIVIVNDKVLNILEDAVEKLKNTGASRIESSLEGRRLAAWKKRYVVEPAIQMSLLAYATSNRVFAETVQLVKRWLGAKHLSGHIHDILVELIVAAALGKKGHTRPLSLWSSFIKVLRLISYHNWLKRPLIVDLNKKWTEEERSKLEENFIKMRPVLPPMVIICEHDTVGTMFTRENPSGIVLKRLIAFAKNTLEMFEKDSFSLASIDFKNKLLYETYANYDGVIELFPEAVVRKQQEFKRKLNARRIPIVELDPVDELIYQLNNNFHQIAIFFYNKYGGESIAFKFKPNEYEVPAKIAKCNYHKSVGDNLLRINQEEIVENIRIMGAGIVKDVKLMKE